MKRSALIAVVLSLVIAIFSFASCGQQQTEQYATKDTANYKAVENEAFAEQLTKIDPEKAVDTKTGVSAHVKSGIRLTVDYKDAKANVGNDSTVKLIVTTTDENSDVAAEIDSVTDVKIDKGIIDLIAMMNGGTAPLDESVDVSMKNNLYLKDNVLYGEGKTVRGNVVELIKKLAGKDFKAEDEETASLVTNGKFYYELSMEDVMKLVAGLPIPEEMKGGFDIGGEGEIDVSYDPTNPDEEPTYEDEDPTGAEEEPEQESENKFVLDEETVAKFMETVKNLSLKLEMDVSSTVSLRISTTEETAAKAKAALAASFADSPIFSSLSAQIAVMDFAKLDGSLAVKFDAEGKLTAVFFNLEIKIGVPMGATAEDKVMIGLSVNEIVNFAPVTINAPASKDGYTQIKPEETEEEVVVDGE